MEIIEKKRQTRKKQINGGSTYIISIPKNWINEMKIKVGENITIVKNSNQSLTFFPQNRDSKEKNRIAIIPSSNKEPGEAIKRKIIAAYLAGYKTMKVQSKGMRIPVVV